MSRFCLLSVILMVLSAGVPVNPQMTEDRVHFGDVIDLDLVGGFEYDWRGTLTGDGFLARLNKFDEQIFALCRTEREIAADAERIFGKTLRNPKVIVRIVDRSKRAVALIDGAVRSPSRFSLRRKAHLNEIIILAGGLTDASSGVVTIFRPANLRCYENGGRDNASHTLHIKIIELLSGKATANPQIFGGDLITVERATPIYVIGAVTNPTPIYAREQITVSRVVATAGGLTKNADGGRAIIFRRDGPDTRAIEIDLEKIRRGESVDEIMRSFDILDVAARGGVKRRFPPIAVTEENKGSRVTDLPLRVIE